MRKFKIDLKLLPSLLGWLFFIIALSFVLSMFLTSSPAHADGLDCAQHKNFLGLRDGWDCTMPASTNDLTLTTDPGTVRCNESTTQCESNGHATLRINKDALSVLGNPRQFQITMSCTTTPGSAVADCKFSSTGEDSK